MHCLICIPACEWYKRYVSTIIIILITHTLNPPHFYITHEEAQCALFHYTGMIEHPNMPAPDKNCLNPDIPLPINVM